MNQPNPIFQIRIHGVDGASSAFAQDDTTLAKRLVSEFPTEASNHAWPANEN